MQAKKEAEERKNAAEEDDMFFTYARDETYDQVPSPKSPYNHTAVNKLKMHAAKVLPNGNSKVHERQLSQEVVDVDSGSLNRRGEDYVDVIDDRQSVDSAVDLRSSRWNRKDSVEKEALSCAKSVTNSRPGRLPRQSSRQNSRCSSRSSSKSRVNRSSNHTSPAHSPRHRKSSSKT